MSKYTPDIWVVLEFNTPQLDQPLRKVFAGWYGGFAGGDHWQLNSGIVKVRQVDEYWEFDGYSGSVYRCHPNNYHMSGLMHSVLAKWLTQAEQRGDTEIRVLTLDKIVKT